MIKVNWDVEELVALIDIYRNSSNMSSSDVYAKLSMLAESVFSFDFQSRCL